ncbi:MAG: carboxypeptidase regulatory-like domain-containing protein [Gemmatimonadaceae bacterium]
MRRLFFSLTCAGTALSAAGAQYATVTGQVVLRDDGQPLGYTTIAVLSQGTQRLAGESGSFSLTVPPGEIRLRFKRIGFVPMDTALIVAANDTARIRIEMARLVIKLPAIAVSGACTDKTPLGDKPAVVAELFEQVKQNAERMRLLAQDKPFMMTAVHYGRFVDGDNRVTNPRTDTLERPALLKPYKPRGVVFPITEGPYKGSTGIMLPELPDLADTAFTNNHCFWYAGQEKLRNDSVIRVDFEPVPWLAKELDLEGSIYLRVDGYQLVGLYTKLNRIPPNNRVLREYTTRAWFIELVSGVSVIDEHVLMNVFRDNRPAYVQTGKVMGIRWLEVPPSRVDETSARE